MPTTDTSEKGLESLIVESLVQEAKYVPGEPKDYDRDFGIDLKQLMTFLEGTQPKTFDQLDLNTYVSKREQFLSRLQGEITKRGIIDVLRKGIKHGPAHIDLYYGLPTPGNVKAEDQYKTNIFSVTRQLRFSKDETRLALDLCLFINGLPVMTFELKNNFTKQNYEDAIQQYRRDRDKRELLFMFGRCMVHFAVDDQQVWMCTELKDKTSWFLPFNKGYNDGAGNPPNPTGIATDYLWKQILLPKSLSEIIENYAQIVEEEDNKGRKKHKQIFPRYHQIDVVKKLLADVAKSGAGPRYLIQHSAGSGKSNSIAWLVHQLVDTKKDNKPVFDSIIVITDRKILDKQIAATVKQFVQVSAVLGKTYNSGDLRKYIQSGKKIIVTTIQKFPFILEEIGDEHRDRKFAIVIDEAHSSQGGRVAAKMHMALAQQSTETGDEEETYEDIVNNIIEARKMLKNASYFAFTATPKNKTLEMFGIRQQDGTFRPFHSYTMKQAIQEGFILDVLRHYTPVESYYRLIKAIEGDPEYDAKKSQKKLRRYVEAHEQAIRAKAEIMIDHFHDNVAEVKIGGKARAMIVTSSIAKAIQYKVAFNSYLAERRSKYKAIVAFSGEHDHEGQQLDEAKMNGFPSSKIESTFRDDDAYRFLIVAEKFQTGYDEPLLHTMYVDKILTQGKAVQTLSRLNRAHPQKSDTFVLDFVNDADTIKKAFEPYYRTTVLSEATDPNKLNALKTGIDEHQIYIVDEVNEFAKRFLSGAPREQLDPILDVCVARYKDDLDTDHKIDCKGKAKTFIRTYSFLATIMPFSNPEWEKLSIFLNFLVPKLPSPPDDDLTKGLLQTIDMDSYRSEVKREMSIALADSDGAVEPVPTSGGGFKREPELDKLSNIIRQFNDLFGNIEWKDNDKIRKVISEEIPAKVNEDKAYQNARENSDKQNARIEHDKALGRVVTNLLADHSELFKQYSGNQSFNKWLADTIFEVTYKK